jgi:D-lactate dehydrogenase (cytochrome)
VIPFGAGSALEGHTVPVQRGISLDVTNMNRILEVRPDDFLVRVEPGVTRLQLNEALKRYGLFFPVDPGADATLGGMAATSASGTTTVHYGAMRDNVRAMTVVLADGREIQTGSLASKSSSGYNLNHLFIGSEGTLGVITELWLKLYGLPQTKVAARAEFENVADCVRASTTLMGAGLPVVRLELVSPTMISAINAYNGTDYSVTPTLFLEFHGNEGGVEADVSLAQALLEEDGCGSLQFERDTDGQNRLWQARHSAALAFKHLRPGFGHMTTDVCVPLSRLPHIVEWAEAALSEYDLDGGIVGHVGDGNFHVSLAVNPDDQALMARAEAFNSELVQQALAEGGTCTGEHGVGLGKRKYQAAEHGTALDIMRTIKSMLDPHHIMNPGKLVDE